LYFLHKGFGSCCAVMRRRESRCAFKTGRENCLPGEGDKRLFHGQFVRSTLNFSKYSQGYYLMLDNQVNSFPYYLEVINKGLIYALQSQLECILIQEFSFRITDVNFLLLRQSASFPVTKSDVVFHYVISNIK
jgi:hypothetical protein